MAVLLSSRGRVFCHALDRQTSTSSTSVPTVGLAGLVLARDSSVTFVTSTEILMVLMQLPGSLQLS